MDEELLKLLTKKLHSIDDAIRGLQASQITHSRLLRAMIKSHPDADAMRQAWRDFSSPSIADAEMSKAADPARLAMHQALVEALNQWDTYLENDLPKP